MIRAAVDAAFDEVFARHPEGCGVENTPKRKAWVARHRSELHAAYERHVAALEVQPSLWEAA